MSFKAALDLRDLLIRLEDVKIELGHLQMRMDALVEKTTEELDQKVKEYRDRVKELQIRREESLQAMRKRLQKVFRANPTIGSLRYHEVIEELRQRIRHEE